jgi:DNA-binding GntR family transcriptional regulator
VPDRPRSDLAERRQGKRSARGRLKPGERLVSRLLASELGISTTPVREALARLASEKALELDHRNTVVVPIPILTAERYEEIRDLRAELEGLAAMRAAGVATAVDGELVAPHEGNLASELKGALESALAYNEQFHFKLCRLCELPLLMTIVEMLWLQCGPLLNHFYSGNVSLWTHPKHPHLEVIRSLERRDGEGARAAIVLDITEGAQPILAKLRSRQSQ